MKMINNTRKKLVTLAVASAMGGAILASAPAQAVNVSQNGVGEVLLFPYYTVKGGYDTVFTLTNTSDRTVVAKIRWREALNSREVRDFNVIMSPHDVWTAAVTIKGTDNAVVRTFDKTCTSPLLPAGSVTGSTEVEFTSIAYDGTQPNFPTDGGGTNLSRVQEGYFEVIEMAISTVPESSITSANKVEYKSQHSSGVPRDCASVDGYFLDSANLTNGATGSGVFSTFHAPENVLKGFATLINVANGQAVEAEPTMLENFQDATTILYAPGDLTPSLADGNSPATALQLNNGVPVSVVYAGSVNAISHILSATNVINEYATGAGAGTDWVLTFPTKHFYTDSFVDPSLLPPGGLPGNPPFAQFFPSYGRSCDVFGVTMYDREEKKYVMGSTGFSPAGQGARLCYEVNVLTFNNSNLLGAAGLNHMSLDTSPAGPAGWANVSLQNTGMLPSSGGATVTGLPVIGFAMTNRDNASVAGNNRNYGTTETHSYVRNVVAP